MKSLFIIPPVLMSLVSFPSWGLSMDDLVQREGLKTKDTEELHLSIDQGYVRKFWVGCLG